MTDPKPCPRVISSTQLALARRAYSIQSETLHIPDRWGLFSAGPPPQQVSEIRDLYSTLIIFCFAYAILAFKLYNELRFGDDLGYFFETFFRFNLSLLTLLGIDYMLSGAHRNDPNYDWGTWEIDDYGPYMPPEAWGTIVAVLIMLFANTYFRIPEVMAERWFSWRALLQSWGLEV